MARRKFKTEYEDPKLQNTCDGSELPAVCRCIRIFREKRHMEQRTLAAAAGVTANSVSNWENGRSRPDITLLPAICRALDISPYELLGMKKPEISVPPQQKKLLENYSRLSAGHQYAVDELIQALLTAQTAPDCPKLCTLTYYGKSLAAGIGDPTEFDPDAETVYVYSTPQTERADSIFRVNGDSMEPRFRNGQDVLVQRLSLGSELSPGEIGAFIVGNETYIKEYRADGLHSLNSNYPVMHFEDEDSVYLIGKVIGTLSPDEYAAPSDIEKYRLLCTNDTGI